MVRKRSVPIGQTIGGILVGFDQQVFRTTPPVNELVAKGTPLKAVAADGGGTLSVGMPDEPADGAAAGGSDADDGDVTGLDPGATHDQLDLTAPGVTATVDLVHGGRLRSVVIDGRELLVTADPDPFRWGCYPMAPYAGRVRDARFTFDGREHVLPRGIGPHAIHGTVLHRAWRRIDDVTIETDLGPDWPFAGRARQSFGLEAGRLEVRMILEADERMPASIGWHPWFLRRPIADGEAGADGGEAAADVGEAELELEAGVLYERDPDSIASRRRITPPPPPWDDAFTDLRRPPVIRWPGWLELTLISDLVDWVVYTEPSHALCVEPQSSPPGAIGLDATIVEPGRPLTATMAWSWRRLDADG